ncbi:lipocalin-like [Hemicordylus capensis]|uniref:lipocalin-like n=1 Tax=Hemicordylus capensis TaxID=884348 RepID=UPI002303F580|nr:lipocalin-like [Hemicordylus capensis]
MKVGLVALGLALLCTASASPVDNVKKISGIPLYSLAVAGNCTCMMKHKDDMKMMKVTLTALDDKSVDMELSIPFKGNCNKFHLNFKENENGHYIHECAWGTKTIDDMVVNEAGWVLVRAIKEKDGQRCIMLGLHAPEREMTPEMQQGIKDYVVAQGIPEDSIKILPEEVSCMENH